MMRLSIIQSSVDDVRATVILTGHESVYQRFIIPASNRVRFAKALDRSVTGSMNQLVDFATLCLAEEDDATERLVLQNSTNVVYLELARALLIGEVKLPRVLCR